MHTLGKYPCVHIIGMKSAEWNVKQSSLVGGVRLLWWSPFRNLIDAQVLRYGPKKKVCKSMNTEYRGSDR